VSVSGSAAAAGPTQTTDGLISIYLYIYLSICPTTTTTLKDNHMVHLAINHVPDSTSESIADPLGTRCVGDREICKNMFVQNLCPGNITSENSEPYL
jgi:hypothetical protein